MSTKAMTIEGKAVLVTGANRGLGQALVEEAVRRGAKRVYAGTRQPLVHPDKRVTPLTLDVTDPAQVHQAAEEVGSLDILFNNAGVALPAELSDRSALERHLAVNLFGTWGVTEAFLPLLTRTGGAVINVVSVAALAARAGPSRLLDLEGGRVLALAVATSPLRRPGRERACSHGRPDRHRHGPRSRHPEDLSEAVARGIFDGVERGEEEIFPDPMSEKMAESWRTGPAKALERQNVALLAAEPAVA
jgi:NAD(P)-dependent dehydrogenase (short-subunit alcohol dehydrogenase family)